MSNSPLTHSSIPLVAELDVLVVGAGSAGCCAAIAAAGAGRDVNMRVGLVERYGFAGGVSTQTLDTFYGFYTPGDAPRKVVGGVPDRVVNELSRSSNMFLRANTYGAGTGITYNPERLKLVWDQLLALSGVRVWFHTMLVDVTTASAGTATGIVVFTKGGFGRIAARRIIDASGDADVCHWLGLDYELAGESDPAQTLTTTFRMCNVDLKKFAAAGGKEMLAAQMDAAISSGRHPLPRKAGSAHAMVQPGCIATVAVRVADVDATNVDELTGAEREGRRQAFIYEEFFRDMVPGYEDAKIIGLSHQIGVRETRRMYGEYRLTRDDCLSARQFDDAVLLCGAPIEDHRAAAGGAAETHWEYVRDNLAYGVPYRTLVPRGRDDLWVAGRCFSATHDAHASCRSMGQTMSMGQAAGVAAAMSIREDVGAREVSVPQLQDALRRLGAVLEMPSETADVSRDAWRRTRREARPS
jgi:hypothetical protein